jgi:DNA-binding response OmpR family regulator
MEDEMAELLADIDGLPIRIRFLIKDLLAEMRSDFISRGADIRALLSSILEKMADRTRGSSVRIDTRSNPTLSEFRSIEYTLVDLPALLNETVLRVGPLELNLLDRTARRGDRQIDLRPREFQLLKYMMQQSDQSLTRATLLKEVWHYRVVPETNLVDVHMGKLRRKVDGPNEAPMIRNVRGVGFILSEAPCSQSSPSKAEERSRNLAVAVKSPRPAEQAVQ